MKTELMNFGCGVHSFVRAGVACGELASAHSSCAAELPGSIDEHAQRVSIAAWLAFDRQGGAFEREPNVELPEVTPELREHRENDQGI